MRSPRRDTGRKEFRVNIIATSQRGHRGASLGARLDLENSNPLPTTSVRLSNRQLTYTTTAAMRPAEHHRPPGSRRLIAPLNPLILLGAVVASAQQVSYTTSVVTSCFDLAGGAPSAAGTAPDNQAPPAAGARPGQGQGHGQGQGQVAYTMPACSGCDCATCTLTSVYTATFSVLCAMGLAAQAYTVTETYVGLSALPGFAAPTRVPYGFTTSVETCGNCGGAGHGGGTPGPLVATITFPSAGRPYLDGFTPMPAPAVGGGAVGAAAPPASAPAPHGSDDTGTRDRVEGIPMTRLRPALAPAHQAMEEREQRIHPKETTARARERRPPMEEQETRPRVPRDRREKPAETTHRIHQVRRREEPYHHSHYHH